MSKECKNCNHENHDAAVICEDCGTEFETSSPRGKPKVTLVRVRSDNQVELPENDAIELPEDGAVLGRGCGIAPEIFDHKYVSEPHCRISINEDDCYIEDIGSEGDGSTNGTFINGDQLPKRTPTKLFHGSRLKIAHLLFDVKIEYPQSAIAEEAAEEIKDRSAWVIVCPICGEKYEVEDSNSRINECSSITCADDVDKKRISRVRPKQVMR